MEVDKCLDDEYEVIDGSSPRPRTVSLDLPRLLTKESLVDLGPSPSGGIPSSASSVLVVSGGDKDEQNENSDTSGRRWNPRALLSRSLVFLVFLTVTLIIRSLLEEFIEEVQMCETREVKLFEKNRKLDYALHVRDARIFTLTETNQDLIMELAAKEDELNAWQEENKGLVKKLEDTESERRLLDADNHFLVEKLRDPQSLTRSEKLELVADLHAYGCFPDKVLVKELDDMKTQRILLWEKLRTLDKELRSHKARETRLKEESMKCSDAVANAVDVLSDCSTSPQPNWSSRIEGSLTAWLDHRAEDRKAWMKEHGIEHEEHVSSWTLEEVELEDARLTGESL